MAKRAQRLFYDYVFVFLFHRPSSSPNEKKEVWVGDPEAIQSVRRPRKTLAQQRLDNLLNRVDSQKDATKSTIQHWKALKRSQSLKERKAVESTSSSSVFSRSRSLKENARTKAMNTMTETLSELDLSNGRRGKRSFRNKTRLSVQSSTSTLRDYSSSPETKSGVWGWVGTASPERLSPASSSSTLDDVNQSRILRRRRLTLMQGIKNHSVDAGALPPICQAQATSPVEYDESLPGSPLNLYSSLPSSPNDPRTPSPFAVAKHEPAKQGEVHLLARKGSANKRFSTDPI